MTLRKTLLVLDGSEAGQAARNMAFDLFHQKKAALTAVGVLDTPWITSAQPEPIGGASYKTQRDEAMIDYTRQHMRGVLSHFQKACLEQEIPHELVEVEGFPVAEIERLSHEHDMIVIGKTTGFHFDLDEESDIVVKHIARDNPRPLMIVPKSPVQGESVVVTLDGSFQSSRALHMFLLLDLAMGRRVHILSMHENPDIARHTAERGARMCQMHGIHATPHVEKNTGNRAQNLLERARELKSSLIVMGGFSHSILKELILGSCTHQLMESSEIPLFLYR